MQVGEFFVNLGIKGSEKTVGALTGVKSGLGDLKSMSLEAKAAILAAVYSFERLMASSSRAGTELSNFNALTGISAQTLQQYQYAARQVGITNEQMQGSFESVQGVMTNMRLGKGAPEGLGMLAGKVGFDPTRALHDTEYVMKKLQEYANKEKEVGMRNSVLKSFGLSDQMISGMSRNAFRPDVMNKAPTYSDAEIGKLDRVNAAWSNLSTKVQMAIGHFNALHGGQLVSDLSKIVDKVVVLAEAFMKLAEALHLFEGVGKVVEGISKVIGIGTEGVKAVSGAIEHPEQRAPLIKNTIQGARNVGGFLADAAGQGTHALVDLLKNQMIHTANASERPGSVKVLPPSNPITPGAIAPKPTTVLPNSSQNNHVNQTFHFQTDGSDHKQVGDAAQKAVTKAFFQIPQGGW